MANKKSQNRNSPDEANTGPKDKNGLNELIYQLAIKFKTLKHLNKRSITAADITRLEALRKARESRPNNYHDFSIGDLLYLNNISVEETKDIPLHTAIGNVTEKLTFLQTIIDKNPQAKDIKRIIELDLSNSIDTAATRDSSYYLSVDDILYYHSLLSKNTSDHEHFITRNYNFNKTRNTESLENNSVSTENNQKIRWVKCGEPISIQGFKITCGLFYVGTSNWPSEISLINPLLPAEYIPNQLRINTADCDGYPLPYKYMGPKTRGSYLAWLSEGRNLAGCDISFLKLYVSGLERRVFSDITQDTNQKNEIQDILIHIKEILLHFNKSDPFASQIRGFDNFLEAYLKSKESKLESRCAQLPDSIPPGGLLTPVSLLTSAFDFYARDEPLPGHLAYDCWKNYSQNRTSSIVDYYPEKFKSLAIEKYNVNLAKKTKKSPQKQKAVKKRNPVSTPTHSSLIIGYRPINCQLDSKTFLTSFEIPELYRANLKRLLCIDKINKIAEAEQHACTYKSDQNLPDLLSLPFILWPAKFREVARDLPILIFSNEKYKLTSFSDIISLFSYETRLRKKYYKVLVEFLGECSIGIEPDPRIWEDTLGSKNFVAYQDSSYNIQSSLTNHYRLSALALDMAAGMNLIEKDINNNKYLDGLVGTQANLTGNEMKRLSAHLRWLMLSDDAKSTPRKLINLVKAEDKEKVGEALIDYSRCQGLMTVQKIKSLEDAFRKLSISKELLYSLLHLDQTYSSTYQSNRRMNNNDKTKPNNNERSSNDLELDLNRLAELEIETSNIADVLNDVFQDEPEHNSFPLKSHSAKGIETKDDCSIWGLTRDLSDLLKTILRRLEWTRQELKELAKSYSLMLDGALEILDESTFHHLDEPLFETFESDNVMTVNENVIKLLTQSNESWLYSDIRLSS